MGIRPLKNLVMAWLFSSTHIGCFFLPPSLSSLPSSLPSFLHSASSSSLLPSLPFSFLPSFVQSLNLQCIVLGTMPRVGSKNHSFVHLRYFSSSSICLALCQDPGYWGCCRKQNTRCFCSYGAYSVVFPILETGCLVWVECLQWERLAWGKVERWAGPEHGEGFGVHCEGRGQSLKRS